MRRHDCAIARQVIHGLIHGPKLPRGDGMRSGGEDGVFHAHLEAPRPRLWPFRRRRHGLEEALLIPVVVHGATDDGECSVSAVALDACIVVGGPRGRCALPELRDIRLPPHHVHVRALNEANDHDGVRGRPALDSPLEHGHGETLTEHLVARGGQVLGLNAVVGAHGSQAHAGALGAHLLVPGPPPVLLAGGGAKECLAARAPLELGHGEDFLAVGAPGVRFVRPRRSRGGRGRHGWCLPPCAAADRARRGGGGGRGAR
mmetsp:Transcript_24782/g.67402  ORF Transcript_24782/g.67402 Transcript_24782/m.67402 type:complete len:259 (+) Transcript_24782:150-926(+)